MDLNNALAQALLKEILPPSQPDNHQKETDAAIQIALIPQRSLRTHRSICYTIEPRPSPHPTLLSSRKLSDATQQLLTLYMLQEGLKISRQQQLVAPIQLAISCQQLSDITFINKLIGMILKHRHSFHNVIVELNENNELTTNVLAIQRGAQLLNRCGIKLGVMDYKSSARLLCELIHFDYIKTDGRKLLGCHLNSALQSQITNLHRTAEELGTRLICQNLYGDEELQWISDHNFFQDPLSLTYEARSDSTKVPADSSFCPPASLYTAQHLSAQ